MLETIAAIESRYDELGELIEKHVDDYQKVAELAKERSDLEEIVNRGREYRTILQQIEEAESLLESPDEELRQLAEADLETLKPRAEALEKAIKLLLVPKDPRDDRNVIVEIRAGTGGEEAALFAGDLFRMYSRYAEKRRWQVEILSQNETGIGGFKEIIFLVKGKGAYSRLKYESGVHRVQRIPVTESSGRIHTSTATVAVLAEVDDVDIEIPESDIRMEVFRSAGAGGQNVQKNSTAVRIIHLPTGIVVSCQDERSQLQNRLRAMSILRAKLYEIEASKRQQELEETRRSQVGSAERAEKIRTYNFPQSRVTDHRIGLSSYNISAVLDGEIDQFIDELALRDEAEKLSGNSFDDDE
ncbi:bacterial peptide chain release factor 1 [Anaerolinea thermolimosa]|uniref:peptide chain release factor 1 n=1 Tax=Anaerolinea thermolimosa TaxID=229919 RepID=UPI0007819A79|nr:peptide chain release factor 1 [Anaerolinea thermolimosa]GAP06823.1 bacterial peptide chain release factor 1 [Anaerolinea thermolimosa]